MTRCRETFLDSGIGCTRPEGHDGLHDGGDEPIDWRARAMSAEAALELANRHASRLGEYLGEANDNVDKDMLKRAEAAEAAHRETLKVLDLAIANRKAAEARGVELHRRAQRLEGIEAQLAGRRMQIEEARAAAKRDYKRRRECDHRHLDRFYVRYRTMRAAMTKINAIRNSIVGCQSVNFSEHVYPLVAALDEAGMPYDQARPHVRTLIERTNKAEAQVAALVGALREILQCEDPKDMAGAARAALKTAGET